MSTPAAQRNKRTPFLPHQGSQSSCTFRPGESAIACALFVYSTPRYFPLHLLATLGISPPFNFTLLQPYISEVEAMVVLEPRRIGFGIIPTNPEPDTRKKPVFSLISLRRYANFDKHPCHKPALGPMGLTTLVPKPSGAFCCRTGEEVQH